MFTNPTNQESQNFKVVHLSNDQKIQKFRLIEAFENPKNSNMFTYPTTRNLKILTCPLSQQPENPKNSKLRYYFITKKSKVIHLSKQPKITKILSYPLVEPRKNGLSDHLKISKTFSRSLIQQPEDPKNSKLLTNPNTQKPKNLCCLLTQLLKNSRLSTLSTMC